LDAWIQLGDWKSIHWRRGRIWWRKQWRIPWPCSWLEASWLVCSFRDLFLHLSLQSGHVCWLPGRWQMTLCKREG